MSEIVLQHSVSARLFCIVIVIVKLFPNINVVIKTKIEEPFLPSIISSIKLISVKITEIVFFQKKVQNVIFIDDKTKSRKQISKTLQVRSTSYASTNFSYQCRIIQN